MLALIFGLLFTSWTYYGVNLPRDGPFGSRLSPKVQKFLAIKMSSFSA